MRRRFSDYEILKPQIETCHGLAMHIEDLTGQLENLTAIRVQQKRRRKRLESSVGETQAIADQQESAHSSLIADIVQFSLDNDRKESENSEVQLRLATLKSEYSQTTLSLADEETEADTIRKNVRRAIEKAAADAQQSEISIRTIAKAIADLRGEIDLFPSTKQRMLQKKMGMIEQLTKRLGAERKARASVAQESSLVDELTATVGEHLLEKGDLEGEIAELSSRLAWLQAEAQKKGWMLEEVHRMIIPNEHVKLTVAQCLKDLEDLVQDTQVQYESCVENLQIADFEITGLEDERATLSGLLAELEAESPG
jgi:chromosome segregation ATPase